VNYQLLSIIVTVAIFVVVPQLFYSGELWKRYAVVTTFFIINILSSMIGFSVGLMIYNQHDYMSSTTALLLQFIFTVTTMVTFSTMAVFAWRMILSRKFRPYFLLLIVMPAGQFLTMHTYWFHFFEWVWILGNVITLVGNIVLLMYVVSLENKTAVEEELRETRYIMELEQANYRNIEERREELMKIRHDFNNQLAAISTMIEVGENGSARDMITTLSKEIMETREYCQIPVINAILTEKVQTCRDIGMDITFDLKIPPVSTFWNRTDAPVQYICKLAG